MSGNMTKDQLIFNLVAARADKLASAGGPAVSLDNVREIAEYAAGKLPSDITDVLSGAQLEGVAEMAIQEALMELSNDKQAHGGAEMSGANRVDLDYVDVINLDADKVASVHGPMAGAEVRLARVAQDVPGVLAAAVEKLAAVQNLVVKIASVVETLAAEAGKQISADQGNANAVIQDGAGKDESTEDELKKLVKVTGEGTGTSYMTGDPTGKESKITNPGNAGAGGIAPNKAPTTGDIIANANARGASTKQLFEKIKLERSGGKK
jgi:hypothetical protein